MTTETLSFIASPLLAQAAPAPGGGATMQLLILGLLFAGMWFLIIAPQRKKQKQLDAMVKALKQGDEVLTTGGMYGTIVSVRSDRFIVRIGENTRVEMAKGSIASVVKQKGDKSEKADSAEETK